MSQICWSVHKIVMLFGNVWSFLRRKSSPLEVVNGMKDLVKCNISPPVSFKPNLHFHFSLGSLFLVIFEIFNHMQLGVFRDTYNIHLFFANEKIRGWQDKEPLVKKSVISHSTLIASWWESSNLNKFLLSGILHDGK